MEDVKWNWNIGGIELKWNGIEIFWNGIQIRNGIEMSFHPLLETGMEMDRNRNGNAQE